MMRKSSVFSMMVFALLKMPSATSQHGGQTPGKNSDSYTNPWLRKLALAHMLQEQMAYSAICSFSHLAVRPFESLC